MPRFVVDDSSFVLDQLEVPKAIDVIEKLLDRIDDALAAGHGACYDEALFEMAIRDGLSFWELCDPSNEFYLPHEMQQRAASLFGTLPKWHETNTDWPVDFDIAVGDLEPKARPALAWAHARASDGMGAVACICASHMRAPGAFSTVVAGDRKQIWFVESAPDVEHYFRWLLANNAQSPADFEAVASEAFEQLEFAPGCFGGIRSMSKTCRQLAPMITAHLGVLSDHGKRIFLGSWQLAAAEFGALGVNISDENGNTKSNSGARAARTISIDGVDRIFWWHTKFEPHQDRIHICPDKVAVGGAVIVGIFCDHLTT